MGGTYLIQSVPAELNMDHTVVLQLAEVRLCLLSVCVCVCTCVYTHVRDSLGGDFREALIFPPPIIQGLLLNLSNGGTTQTCAYLADIY